MKHARCRGAWVGVPSSGGGDAKEGGAAFALAVLAIGARPAPGRWQSCRGAPLPAHRTLDCTIS